MKQISTNILRNIFSSCSKWTSSQQFRGSCWSIRDWCCWKRRRVLFVFLFVEQNVVFCWTSHLQIIKRCWWKGGINARSKTASTSSWSISQLNSTSSRYTDTWYALVTISCATTLESTSSIISCVSCWLGLTGTRARWWFKNYCLWDNNKLQAARGISGEHIAISWTRSSTIRVIESGPKSRDHSIPSFGTAKTMLLYCRLKVYKLIM